MPESLSGLLEALGWQVEVDREDGELTFTHYRSGATIVLDAEGNLTVPGDGDVGGEIDELQSLLASALEEYGSPEPPQICGIDCDEQVTIASAEGIALDAPTIELAADTQVLVHSEGSIGMDSSGSMVLQSSGNLTAEASAVMTLDGALLQLN